MTDLTAQSYRLDRAARLLSVAGKEVKLGARAFDVLDYLDANSGRVVTKAELLEGVWANLNVEEGNLTVQISALRKVLGNRAIATVPGVGYKLTLAADAPVTPNESLPLPEKPSLAVLPFANLTGDPDKTYLVDGIVSDMIGALSLIPSIFVISASSTFTLKGQSVDLADIGKRLGVRYILEGGIQQAGDRLRINTQLVEAETGHTIWSSRFSGALADVFDLQDEVTEQVAAAIEPNVIFAESRRASAKPTTELDAYDLCLRAAPRLYRMADRESFDTGLALLERALEIDPDYIEARSLKCRAHMMACASRFIGFPEARTILPLADALLSTPDADASTLAMAGHTVAYLGHAFDRGQAAISRALAMNPNSSMNLIHSGWVHSYLGHAEVSLAHFGRSMRLNPIDPRNPQIRSGIGMALIADDRIEEALVEFEAAYAAAPEWATSYNGLIICLTAVGRMDDARRFRDLLLASAPDTTVSGYLRDSPHRTPVHRDHIERAYRAVGIPE
ncbi:hypothetical protein HKCCE3408_11170 [Rhodobacterales bacterium HKCCE3408]|nr:hypothetical protein [Rhodobacterales bacterium HKCCE3408]